jgi:hypothetical protein
MPKPTCQHTTARSKGSIKSCDGPLHLTGNNHHQFRSALTGSTMNILKYFQFLISFVHTISMSELIAVINITIFIITTIQKHHYAESGGLYVLFRVLYVSMTHGLKVTYKFITNLIHSNRYVMFSSWNAVSSMLWNSLAADKIIVDK